MESSPVIYQELERAHKSLALDNELHLLYLVTPLNMKDLIEPDWMTYFRQVCSTLTCFGVGHLLYKLIFQSL